MSKWGYIGLSCVAFWFQGLFFGWESCLYLVLLGLIIGFLSIKPFSIRIPKLEGVILILFFIGYNLALFQFPNNTNLISLVQIGIVCLSVLVGFSVITKFKDVVDWYATFQWNVLALIVVGWVIRSNGLLGSVFDYANIVAALCIITIFYLFPQLFTTDPKKRWTTIVLLVVYVCSLILTGARIAWGITCAGLLIQALFLRGTSVSSHVIKRIWWGGVVSLAMILLTIRTFIQDTWQELIQLSSLRIRITYDWDALRIAFDHPWLGVGADGWNKLQYQYQTALYSVRHIHNHFLQLWLDGGLLSLIAWCMFICLLFHDLRFIRKCADKKVHEVMCSVWLSTVAIVLYSSLDFILSFPALFFMVLFYLVARQVIWYQRKQTENFTISKAVVLAISAVLVMGGLLGGYRELLSIRGEAALDQGEIRTVLQYEQIPTWSMPSQARFLLLGKAYIEKAKRTNHPKDWQMGLFYLGEGIQKDPQDARFYPPYVYSLLKSKEFDQAATYAHQLVRLQPSLTQNYELYAEALFQAGKADEVRQIPNELFDYKQHVYQTALFKRYIPQLVPTGRIKFIMQESDSH